MKIRVEPLDQHEQRMLPSELGFGRVFTDRMFVQR
jgi:hypothetical protein